MPSARRTGSLRTPPGQAPPTERARTGAGAGAAGGAGPASVTRAAPPRPPPRDSPASRWERGPRPRSSPGLRGSPRRRRHARGGRQIPQEVTTPRPVARGGGVMGRGRRAASSGGGRAAGPGAPARGGALRDALGAVLAGLGGRGAAPCGPRGARPSRGRLEPPGGSARLSGRVAAGRPPLRGPGGAVAPGKAAVRGTADWVTALGKSRGFFFLSFVFPRFYLFLFIYSCSGFLELINTVISVSRAQHSGSALVVLSSPPPTSAATVCHPREMLRNRHPRDRPTL